MNHTRSGACAKPYEDARPSHEYKNTTRVSIIEYFPTGLEIFVSSECRVNSNIKLVCNFSLREEKCSSSSNQNDYSLWDEASTMRREDNLSMFRHMKPSILASSQGTATKPGRLSTNTFTKSVRCCGRNKQSDSNTDALTRGSWESRI